MSSWCSCPRCAVALVALVALSLGGCASDRAIRAWQDSLETYVMERGNGDPNVLRALAEDPAAADFGLIGAQRGGVPFFLPARTDVTGLLVGHRRLGDRFWFIFVAGAIKYRGSFTDFPLDEPQVVDLRAAAFSLRDGAFAWQVSEPDKEALRRYRDRQVELWCRNQPDTVDPAMAPTTFPTPADDWTLTIEDEGITITDTHSGATLGTVPFLAD